MALIINLVSAICLSFIETFQFTTLFVTLTISMTYCICDKNKKHVSRGTVIVIMTRTISVFHVKRLLSE